LGNMTKGRTAIGRKTFVRKIKLTDTTKPVVRKTTARQKKRHLKTINEPQIRVMVK